MAFEIVKPFIDGEKIQKYIKAITNDMCERNLFKTDILPANTMVLRMQHTAENISSQLSDKNVLNDFLTPWMSQILLGIYFFGGVDSSYAVYCIDSLDDPTTGECVKGVENSINKKNLQWKNVKCVKLYHL